MDALIAEMTITNFIAVDLVLLILVGMVSAVGFAISDHAPRLSVPVIMLGLALLVFSAYFNLAVSVAAFKTHDIILVILSLLFTVVIVGSLVIQLVSMED